MIVVRPTLSLAKRMREKISECTEKSKSILGDWYAIELVFERKQFVFCMSEHGRLPVALQAAPYASFPERLPKLVFEILIGIGVPKKLAENECGKMGEYKLGKTDNRSVLGTMKQMRIDLDYFDPPGRAIPIDPLGLSLELCDFGTMSLPEFTPQRATRKLFGLEPKGPIENRPHLRLVNPG